MSLFMDIGQGAGLAGASGVRPFLPPLLAGALAREDSGLDFDGTSFSFLESPAFMLAVLALAVGSYAFQRRRETVAQTKPAGRPGDPPSRCGSQKELGMTPCRSASPSSPPQGVSGSSGMSGSR